MNKDSKFQIFLVDDDSFSLEIYRQHLANLGYTEVTTFTDGQACLNQLTHDPAVIFLDHQMEPLDGLELLKKIKRFDPNILTVFISGQEEMEVAINALKYGAFDYLIKGEGLEKRITSVMHKLETVMMQMPAKPKRRFLKFFPSLTIAFFWLMAASMTLTSCATQNLFQQDPSIKEDPTVFQKDTAYQYHIRIDDKVSISVWDHDDLSVGSIYGIYNSNEVYGKWLLVDANGNISVPQLGEVHAAGKTIIEMEKTLGLVYAKYIQKPIVEVKVLNKEVTVMGEMKSPGKFLLEKEQNTLVEMLGKAGDFDFYADRTKVQVIRTVEGQPKSVTVDLTELQQYTNSNIYLKPGDVVYVPARKSKTWDKRSGSIIIPATALITTVVLVATAIN